MTHYQWTQVAPEQLSPKITRRAIHCATMTVAHFELLKDAVIAEHSHHNEQVTTVESGVLEFTMEGRTFQLSAGESLVIPSHVPHAVVALEDSQVVDVFSPARADWLPAK